VDIPKDETVEIRSSSITSVNARQRIIDMIAVPWEQEAEVFVRGESWREVFNRGAFDGIEAHAGRIRVNREHVYGDTVGKVVRFEDATEGELAQVKVAETLRGDETLALAEEDMISASVGYRVKRPSDVQMNRRTRMRRVMRAFIDHLAMVEAPAYAGAQVLAVRAEPSGLQVAELVPPTPALDEAMNSEVFAWARTRLSR
jgi:HK97 family phage prohead protease